MFDYKTSNNKGFRYIFIIIDNFSKHLWAIPLKNKYNQTITNEFSNALNKSKGKLFKLQEDRGSEFYNNIFQNFLKTEIIHDYSRFSDKSPRIAERVIRSIEILLNETIFLAGNANWLSEVSSVVKKYSNTIHLSTKMTPIQARRKSNENLVYSNLQDRRYKQPPKIKLGQLVRTADI